MGAREELGRLYVKARSQITWDTQPIHLEPACSDQPLSSSCIKIGLLLFKHLTVAFSARCGFINEHLDSLGAREPLQAFP